MEVLLAKNFLEKKLTLRTVVPILTEHVTEGSYTVRISLALYLNPC